MPISNASNVKIYSHRAGGCPVSLVKVGLNKRLSEARLAVSLAKVTKVLVGLVTLVGVHLRWSKHLQSWNQSSMRHNMVASLSCIQTPGISERTLHDSNVILQGAEARF